TGASPSVDEPTRMSSVISRSGAAHVGASALWRAPSSLRSRVRLTLVVDAEARPRDRREPPGSDRLPAHLAGSEGPGLDLAQRVGDRGKRLLRALLEALVELAVVGRGRSVAEVVVA